MHLEPLVLALALATAGCVNVDYVPTSPAPRPMRPRAAADVMVFQAGAVGRSHVEVAYLELDAQTNDPEFLIDQIRQQAGDRGCDGVVLLASPWTTIRATKKRGYRAACIVFSAM
jgi:hypothetical protein